jgi:Protein kinase domain
VSDVTSVSLAQTVGRYELVREIGRGGSAVVYLARQTDLDREVALKELASFHASDPAFVSRFLRESRLTGALNHPNIVTVHEFFEHEGTPFIAMEYFPRGSLRPYVGRIDLAQVAGVLEGLLGGLAHAQLHGIVHRDLKPENVMVSSTGGVKIADFGMAKAHELQAASDLTSSGATVGTPAYMAPEQALGASVTHRSDLYSVGVIAYELLSGRVPFDQKEAPIAIMLRHLNEEPPSLHTLQPELEPELVRWVERLLAKTPEARPASAVDAAEELEEIMLALAGARWRRRSRLVADAEPSPPPAAPTTTLGTLRVTRALATKRGRVWIAVALLALLGAGGAGAAFALTNGSPSAPAAERTTTSARSERSSRHQTAQGPVLTQIALVRSAGPAMLSLRLGGSALKSRDIVVRDGDLLDGRALLQVRQRGVRAVTRGGTFGPLSLLVRKAKGLLRIDVAARPGVFSKLRARMLDGHRIVLSAEHVASTTRSVSSQTTPPASTSTPVTTTTTSTAPPPRKKSQRPAIDTG